MPQIELETGATAEAIRNHKAEPGRVVIAIGPYVWGKGKTTKQAIANARRYLDDESRRRASYMILDAPEGTTITESGRIQWTPENGDPFTGAPRELGRIK